MYNMYSYMYNMYVNSNNYEHVPVSVSHSECTISSQSEHSTSKSWMLKDSKSSVTKLGSKRKVGVGSMSSLHKSKYSFKVSSTIEYYKSIYIKCIVRVLTSNNTYCTLLYCILLL